MRDHPRRLADRRQVVGPVPLGEQREIREQLVARVRRQRSAATSPACATPSARSTRDRAVMPTRSARRPRAREAALQMHEQQRDRRRRHAGNARGLADRLRPCWLSFCCTSIDKPAHRCDSRGRRAARSVFLRRRGARSRRAGDRCSPRTWSRSRPARRRPGRSTGVPAPGSVISARVRDAGPAQQIGQRVLALDRLPEHAHRARAWRRRCGLTQVDFSRSSSARDRVALARKTHPSARRRRRRARVRARSGAGRRCPRATAAGTRRATVNIR